MSVRETLEAVRAQQAEREHEQDALPGAAARGDDRTQKLIENLAARMQGQRIDSLGNSAAVPIDDSDPNWSEAEDALDQAADIDDEY